MQTAGVKPKYFRSAAAFRDWLEKHHASKAELWVGFYKKSSNRGGLTYKEAVDEGLCFGWIDGLVKGYDDVSYMQRFTPRKKDSHWSLVNVRRFGELDAAGRIHPAGRAAFERKTPQRTGKASFESPLAELTPAQQKRLKANRKAWEFFESQPPGYKRTVKHWVTTAKQEETRDRRLGILIDHSARAERIPQFLSNPKKR
jgi:uncharacterized protein YdeI (YjbR/CyaY-like superfamily)